MRTLTLIISWTLTLLYQSVLADTIEDFGKQMTYFYLSPTQESFNSFQRNADRFRDELVGGKNGADLLVTVMIARISQMYHWPTIESAFSEPAKEIAHGKTPLAKYIQDDSQVDPKKLDVWWASFFATGDENYLNSIFQFAGQELPRGDLGKMLVVGAATWSFKSNCTQHRKVLEFVKQKLSSHSLSKAQTNFANECIRLAESQDRRPGISEPKPKI